MDPTTPAATMPAGTAPAEALSAGLPASIVDPALLHDLSPWGLFLMADPIVKGVMLVLILTSIACWTIIFEKILTFSRLRGEIRELAAMVSGERVPATLPDRADIQAAALRAGIPEWRHGQGPNETDGEYRARLEGAMRKAVARHVKTAERGLSFLATTGAVAPFVGLFGTVWGIMRSFIGIAASNDTSLAVVAPGIAEALFATAIGLVAAIPAVIAYNRLSSSLSALRSDALAAASGLATRLARSNAPAAARPRLRPAE